MITRISWEIFIALSSAYPVDENDNEKGGFLQPTGVR